MPDEGLFSALSCLMQSGAGLLVGTTDDLGVPRATRAWGMRLDAVGRMRVTMSADDLVVVENLAGGMLAVTAGDVRTLRSAQLKGAIIEVSEPDEDDMAAAAEQTEAFFRGIAETDGYEVDVLRRILPVRYLAVVVDVSSGFDQTPGPAAGAALEGTR